jgi:predicted DNA-binding transcriptional regulator AlpA
MATEVLDGYLEKRMLAAQLGCSPRTLDRWHVRRVGPPRVALGRRILYRVDSVRAWLQGCEQQQGRKRIVGRRVEHPALEGT